MAHRWQPNGLSRNKWSRCEYDGWWRSRDDSSRPLHGQTFPMAGRNTVSSAVLAQVIDIQWSEIEIKAIAVAAVSHEATAVGGATRQALAACMSAGIHNVKVRQQPLE